MPAQFAQRAGEAAAARQIEAAQPLGVAFAVWRVRLLHFTDRVKLDPNGGPSSRLSSKSASGSHIFRGLVSYGFSAAETAGPGDEPIHDLRRIGLVAASSEVLGATLGPVGPLSVHVWGRGHGGTWITPRMTRSTLGWSIARTTTVIRAQASPGDPNRLACSRAAGWSRALNPFGCVHGHGRVLLSLRKDVTNGDRANLNAIEDNRDALPRFIIFA